MLGRNGHEATVEECQRRFDAHCKGESLIPADLRGAVYGTVMAHGDESTLEAIIDLYMKSDHQEEKVRLMRNMGGSEHKHVVDRALKFAMSVSQFYVHLYLGTFDNGYYITFRIHALILQTNTMNWPSVVYFFIDILKLECCLLILPHFSL